MTRWYPGAFNLGIPVQPIILKYDNEYTMLDYVVIGPLLLIYLSCAQFINYVKVEIPSIYIPTAQEKSNPLVYACNVRNHVAKCMGLRMPFF